MSVLLRRYYQLLNYSSYEKWLTKATQATIRVAFGVSDGTAVIVATAAYLSSIALTDPTKAQDLAGFINEDPMMVCSLGLQVQGVTMPIRCAKTNGDGYIDSGIIGNEETRLVFKGIMYDDVDWSHACFGSDTAAFSQNFTSWIRYREVSSDSIGYAAQQIYSSGSMPYTPLNKIFEIDANKAHWTNKLADGTIVWDKTFTQRSFTTPSTMAVGAYKRNNTPDPAGHKGIALCDITQASIHKTFIPLISRNSLLDMESLVVYPNLGTGVFVEAMHNPDGTPWIPANQTS